MTHSATVGYATSLKGRHSPKVDQAEDQTGDDGKVREVKAHGSTRRNGEGNVVFRADGSVQSNCCGNDDVADSTSCLQVNQHWKQDQRCFLEDSHGYRSLTPAEAKSDNGSSLLHRANVGAICHPQPQKVDAGGWQGIVSNLSRRLKSYPASLRFPNSSVRRNDIHVRIRPAMASRKGRSRGIEPPVIDGQPLPWLQLRRELHVENIHNAGDRKNEY